MKLKDIITKEIKTVFLKNADEFGDELLVGTNSANAVRVIGSLPANEVDNNSGTGAALQSFSCALFCEYPIGGTLTLTAGQVLYINNKPYKVIDFEDFMGMATIHLLKRG